jgi:hypothetical protein
MWRHWKTHIIAGMFAALAFGTAGAVPAAAQSIPIIPPIGPNLAGCVVVSGLSGCININPVLPVPSGVIIAPGIDQRGGPLHEEGGRDVDIDRNTHDGRALAR